MQGVAKAELSTRATLGEPSACQQLLLEDGSMVAAEPSAEMMFAELAYGSLALHACRAWPGNLCIMSLASLM